MTDETSHPSNVAIFDHPAPGLRTTFFVIPDLNARNREKAQQESKNYERIKSLSHEGLVMEWSREKRWCIRATRKFWNGDFLLDYCGTLVSEAEGIKIERQLEKDGRDDSFLFYFELDSKDLCIDATRDDGMYGRLVNHSRLRPNCKAIGMMFEESPKVIITAIRDIRPGEEILYDYGERRPEVIENCS